jgi:chemotaxis protein methyltransferase CheR
MMISIEFSEDDLKNLGWLLKSLGMRQASLKKSHLLRRVRVRMMRTGCEKFSEYYQYVQTHKEERQKLFLTFSINVTRFFRNADTFQFIEQQILPIIRTRVRNGRAIKIWSAGCADGAEPYSLAMLCEQSNLSPTHVKIIATDFNHELLFKARKGIYPQEYLEETSPDIQRKYFSPRASNMVQISPHLLDYIDFRIHNLTLEGAKAPSSRVDLIVCRNVLIYFSKEQQDHIFHMFHKGLIIHGFLVLGRTELVHPRWRDKFKPYNTVHRIATKI